MIKEIKNYIKQFDKQTQDKLNTWISPTLSNYLKKSGEKKPTLTEIEHILDFLASNQAPLRIKYMSYDEAKQSALKWTKTLQKKGANILETDDDVKVILDFKNGVKLVRLIGQSAFKREGHLMRHCVASYYNNEDCYIYSLRDSKNMPHCTLEVKKNSEEIYQIKGKGNGPIHPKYIKYILTSLKKLGTDIRESEMCNLGYEKLDDDVMKWLETNFNGIKYIMFKGKKFFYNNSKLIRK